MPSKTVLEKATDLINDGERGVAARMGNSQSALGYFIMVGLTVLAEQIGNVAESIRGANKEKSSE